MSPFIPDELVPNGSPGLTTTATLPFEWSYHLEPTLAQNSNPTTREPALHGNTRSLRKALSEAWLKSPKRRSPVHPLAEDGALATAPPPTSLLNYLPTAAFLKDAASLKYVFCNPAAERLLRRSSQELIGQDDRHLFDPETAAALALQDRAALARVSVPVDLERCIQHPKHGPTCFKWQVVALPDAEGKVRYLLGTIENHTPLHQAQAATIELERQLWEKNSQLERENLNARKLLENLQLAQTHLVYSEKMAGLGQLIAGVAHEINNPLNCICGNLNYAQAYTKDLLTLIETYQASYPQPTAAVVDCTEEIDLEFLQQDLREMLESMSHAADRLRQLVTSLRNFSRLDEPDVKPVDLHEGLDSTLLILHNRLKDNGDRPAIQVHKTYGSLPLVMCYGSALNQVFMNLLANAIDALDDWCNNGAPVGFRPEITLATRILADGQRDSQVEITISDNGPGIPKAVRDHIFEPLFTTKPLGKGSGLGLAISRSIIVEKHGGSLTCSSMPGQGSQFTLRLWLV